jgi:hypothetical protein
MCVFMIWGLPGGRPFFYHGLNNDFTDFAEKTILDIGVKSRINDIFFITDEYWICVVVKNSW